MPYSVIPESVIPEYVTPETVPVSPEIVLILIPFWEAFTSLFSKRTVSTVLSDLPPTDPMDKPCPPEQTPPEKVMLYGRLVCILEDGVNRGTYGARVDGDATVMIAY